MNILFTTPYLPYPPNSGGNIRTFNLIKMASKYHNISLVSLVHKDEFKYISELEKYCSVYPIEINSNKYGRIFSLFSFYPYQTMLKYHSKYFKQKIQEVIHQNEFAVIQIESLHMVANLTEINLPKILDSHNIESDILRRIFEANMLQIKSILNYVDYLKNLIYERKSVREMDGCIAVSESDLKRLSNMGSKRAMLLPNCVDLNYYKQQERKQFTPRIVFTGLMNWYPNVDAIDLFCKTVYSSLKEKIPDIEFYIVGRNPSQTILKYSSISGITITGEVADVRQFVADADICIVPLRIGGGTRLKILEYFAMHKPVISTSIGVEGIDVVNKEHLIIEDDISKFPDRIVELLANKKLQQKMVANSYKLVQEKYSWDNYEDELNKLYTEVSNAF